MADLLRWVHLRFVDVSNAFGNGFIWPVCQVYFDNSDNFRRLWPGQRPADEPDQGKSQNVGTDGNGQGFKQRQVFRQPLLCTPGKSLKQRLCPVRKAVWLRGYLGIFVFFEKHRTLLNPPRNVSM